MSARGTVAGIMSSSRVWTLAFMIASGCAEPQAKTFIKPAGPLVAIAHVGVIDGTGAAARTDQTVLIRDGRIAAVGSAPDVPIPGGAMTVDGRDRTVIPGLVGMHEHLFYENSNGTYPAAAAFARLYLASGVTTIRTAGTVDLDEDLRIKRAVDAGTLPGPKIHVTSPYFGASDPAAIAPVVAGFADRGVTSFKAYTTNREYRNRTSG